MGKDKDLERSKKNPRSETIERQIQRMIYPSRSHAHRVRRAQHGRITQRESNIMQFVNASEMASASGSGMDDSLAELLSHLSGAPQRLNIGASNQSQRPSQSSSAFLTSHTPSKRTTEKPKEENISARFLLDTLSDEEDSSPEEFKQQKCDFFQDLLLSTLTSRGLSLNVDVSDHESESEVSESGGQLGSSNFMRTCSKKRPNDSVKREKMGAGSPSTSTLMLENNNNRPPEAVDFSSDSESA